MSFRKKNRLKSKFSLAFGYLENFVFLRRLDYLLCSYPKSGNTWVRILYFNYLNSFFSRGDPFTFPMLDRVMPELGRSRLSSQWMFEPSPRAVKTHMRFQYWLSRAPAVLIVRNPADVMISYFRYMQGLSSFEVNGGVSQFLRHPVFGVDAWMRYHQAWVPHAGLLVSYRDLKADTAGEFSRCLEFMGVKPDKDRVLNAVEASSFDKVRSAESRGHSRPDEIKEGFKFARDGSDGQAIRQLDTDDLEFIDAVWSRYPDLLRLRRLV